MFRKMMVFLAVLLLLFGLTLPVSAAGASFVADDAGLLLSGEIGVLEEKSKELWDDYGIHAVILTVDSLGGTRAQDYADDYYDGAGYGDDGVLFLLAMAERECYIYTSGNMRYALTDYGIQQVGESMVPYLGKGNGMRDSAYFWIPCLSIWMLWQTAVLWTTLRTTPVSIITAIRMKFFITKKNPHPACCCPCCAAL